MPSGVDSFHTTPIDVMLKRKILGGTHPSVSPVGGVHVCKRSLPFYAEALFKYTSRFKLIILYQRTAIPSDSRASRDLDARRDLDAIHKRNGHRADSDFGAGRDLPARR